MTGPPSRARSPNSTRAIADGSVKPSHAAIPPAIPARRVPIRIPIWLLAGPGSELAERHEVGVGGLIEPAPALDVLPPEIAEVGDRSTERRQPQPKRHAEGPRWRSRGCAGRPPSSFTGRSVRRLAALHDCRPAGSATLASRRSGGTADAADLNSAARKGVRVRISAPAPTLSEWPVPQKSRDR